MWLASGYAMKQNGPANYAKGAHNDTMAYLETPAVGSLQKV